MPIFGDFPLPTFPDRKETLEQLYRRGRARLAAAPGAGDNTPMEAAFLFQKAFGLSRGDLLARGGESPSPEKAAVFEELLRRRLAGEPLQYLLGEWEFFGLPFLVGPGVLIPRPETELLVETALKLIEGVPFPTLLDLCSGSGCIPIALGVSRPDAQVWGVELSSQAFSYLKQNLALNGAGNVAAVAGDVFSLPPEVTQRKYRLITANPPYIPRGELPGLQQEVQAEPAMALDGGPDGLDFYRRLPSLCAPLLDQGGALLFEIGDDQGNAVSALMREAGYQKVQVLQDLSGLDRVVFGFF